MRERGRERERMREREGEKVFTYKHSLSTAVFENKFGSDK